MTACDVMRLELRFPMKNVSESSSFCRLFSERQKMKRQKLELSLTWNSAA